MYTVIAFVLAVLTALFPVKVEAQLYTVHLANEDVSEDVSEREWSEFHMLATIQYEDEFTALFHATEVKWSKNGRIMVKGAESKSFKFAPKA